ncbi:MAG: hypothetical protein KC589_00070 [Nanoarchaeota archaeon]|nr:hypothetical protein [Nanoarchaeota archaeon]
MVQIHSSLLTRDSSLGTRDRREAQISHLSNSTISNSKTEENLQKILFSVYKINEVKFYSWFKGKKVTENYIKDLNNVLLNTLRLKFKTPLELRDRLQKVKNRKYRALALRNLFNFCEEYELLDQDLILKLKARIKITEKSKIDSFIPSDTQINEFLEKISSYCNLSYLFVKILLESGLRVSEVQHFVKELDLSKFEVVGGVAVYPMYYLRGTKSSYYLFISKELYLQLCGNLQDLKKFNVEKLKMWIKRNGLIPLKYTRKYNFTQLIKNDVSFEVANFIQGRVSQNIGFNHYLAKKEVAVKEYGKML